MKLVNVFSGVALTVAALLSGCGGGGSSDPAPIQDPAPPVQNVPPPAQGPVAKKCPDDSLAPATGTASCPVVGPNAPVTFSTVDPHLFKQGLTIQFNGTLDPSSVTNTNIVLWKGAADTGTKVVGTVSLAAEKDLTYAATQWLAYGQSYTLVVKPADILGRPVQLTVPFTTTAMNCSDSTVWSTPATFSGTYQDCVTPIGVQALVNPKFNTLQDNTCVVKIGEALTAECKAYMANGTMLLASTGVTVSGHSTMWATYLGTDGKTNIVLLDTNAAGAVPIASAILASPLVWIIANPTGLAICTADGQRLQVTVSQNLQLVFS